MTTTKQPEPEQITRTEPHRDGNGRVIGLDCYSSGPGSQEVLVGLATADDVRGEDEVEIDGEVYALTGVRDSLARLS